MWKGWHEVRHRDQHGETVKSHCTGCAVVVDAPGVDRNGWTARLIGSFWELSYDGLSWKPHWAQSDVVL